MTTLNYEIPTGTYLDSEVRRVFYKAGWMTLSRHVTGEVSALAIAGVLTPDVIRAAFGFTGYLDDLPDEVAIRMLDYALDQPEDMPSEVWQAWLKNLIKFFPRRDGEVAEWQPLGYLLEEPMTDILPFKQYLAKYMPHVSTEDPAKIAVIQSADKLVAGRAPIKTTVGRWVSKLGCDISQTQLERIAKMHRIHVGLATQDVRWVSNDDVDGWEAVYRSDNIRSCMNNDSYGVTEHDTYRCYATSAFGLEDNGLRLAYLEHPVSGERGSAVARCIVHEPTKTFVRVYGDDNLQSALESMGYEKVGSYPEGLILWAGDEYYAPYVDGNRYEADHYWSEGTNCGYWQLDDSGEYSLQETRGVLNGCTCAICGEHRQEYAEVIIDDSGTYESVCESCYDYRTSYVYYLGDQERIPDDVPVIAVRESSRGHIETYLDSDRNRDYYDIVWSDYEDEYIRGDIVWSEAMASYIFAEDAVIVSFTHDAIHENCAAYLEVGNQEYVIHMDDTSIVDGVRVPDDGLSDEWDKVRAMLLSDEDEDEDEIEKEAA